jgi:hypothetical protein
VLFGAQKESKLEAGVGHIGIKSEGIIGGGFTGTVVKLAGSNPYNSTSKALVVGLYNENVIVLFSWSVLFFEKSSVPP